LRSRKPWSIANTKAEDTNIVFVDVARDDWALAGKLIVDG
jgi:phenylpyruvate tautomerase PptA (4-oxalocrotonate tautomerase family)